MLLRGRLPELEKKIGDNRKEGREWRAENGGFIERLRKQFILLAAGLSFLALVVLSIAGYIWKKA